MANRKAGVYVAIDTNILIRLVTQSSPGCEPAHLTRLEELLDVGKATLLVPEVVTLEFEKYVASIPKKLEKISEQIDAALDGLAKPTGLNSEFGDAVPFLKAKRAEWQGEKLTEIDNRIDNVRTLLRRERGAVSLPFDAEILLRERRSVLSGETPNPGSSRDADRFIIESLGRFFDSGRETEDQFLLCTENIKDFAIRLENGTYALHTRIAAKFPNSTAFTDLASLVGFISKQKHVEPVDPAIIAAAVNRQRQQRRNAARQIQEFRRRSEAAARAYRAARHLLASHSATLRAASDLESLQSLVEDSRSIEKLLDAARHLSDVEDHGKLAEHLADVIELGHLADEARQPSAGMSPAVDARPRGDDERQPTRESLPGPTTVGKTPPGADNARAKGKG